MAVLTEENIAARFKQLIGKIKTLWGDIPVNQTEVTSSDVGLSDLTIATPLTSGTLGKTFNEKTKSLKDANFTEEKSGILVNYENNTLKIVTYEGTNGQELDIPIASVDEGDFTEQELNDMWDEVFGTNQSGG